MRTQVGPSSPELTTLARAALVNLTFVQVAAAARIDGHRLTLLDLSPTTLWLHGAGPERVGYMATGTFLDLWWGPESGLATAFLEAELGPADPEVATSVPVAFGVGAPRISGSGLQYDVEVLTGVLPQHCGACVLFIGPGSHPMTTGAPLAASP